MTDDLLLIFPFVFWSPIFRYHGDRSFLVDEGNLNANYEWCKLKVY